MSGRGEEIQVGSYKFRVDRSAEGGGFQQYHVRDENPEIRQGAGVLASRQDEGLFHQTSWSGGSAWWKPTAAPTNADLYFTSKNVNVWERPGYLMPGNDVETVTATNLSADSPLVAGVGEFAAIGTTATVNALYFDAFEYDASADAWELASTARTTGVPIADDIYAMCYDPNDDYYYVAHTGNISRFKTGSATFDSDWLAVTARKGCSLFVHNGSLFWYDADALYTVSKGGPTLVSVTDDGQGPDVLVPATGTGPLYSSAVTLAIGTPEGVYYVKNVLEGGSVTPYVYRVERDAAGNWTGYAVAVLPNNTIALSIASHLGSILVSASNDVGKVLANIKTDLYKILIYEITNSNYQVLGSPLGGESPDETPFSFLGSDGTVMFIGGQKRVWAYDAARGGLHPAYEYSSPSDFSPISLVNTDGKTMWNQHGTVLHVQPLQGLNPLGNGAGQVLESIPFDFGLPFELKKLTGVSIIGEDMTSYDTFTVSVQTDDSASWKSVLVYTSADGVHDTATYANLLAGSNPSSAYKFRYKIVYTSSATVGQPTKRPKVAGLLFEAATGSLRKAWRVTVDGTAITNVDNQPARPDDVFDNLTLTGALNLPQAFVHSFGEFDQPNEATQYVKVSNVEVRRQNPNEIESAVITLVEA